MDTTSSNLSASAASSPISNRRRAIEAVVIAWLVFSAGYVVVDQIDKFKTRNVTEHYERGKNDGRNEAVMALLELAGKCQPIDIAAGEHKTQFIATACLQQQQQGAPQQQAQAPQTP